MSRQDEVGATPDELDGILDDLLKQPYEVCNACGHGTHSHYWNGAGNPDNAGWSTCKTADCKCEALDGTQADVERITLKDEPISIEEAKQKLRAWRLLERRKELVGIMFADLPASVKDALKPYLMQRDQELEAEESLHQLDQASTEGE